MPRATHRRNAQFLEWLQDLKNEQEPDSNRYHVYSKALKGLKAETKEFITPSELIAVKHIGPSIVAALEKRYALENGGPSSSQPVAAAPPKPRGRPLKRTATDLDIEPPPAVKRRTVSAAGLSTATQPAQAATTTLPADLDAPFQFWYLDGNKRVRNRGDAQVSWCEDGSQLLRMKIGYPLSQANHPLASQLFGRERQGDSMVAEMREDTAEPFAQCPPFKEASAPEKRPSLTVLLEEDKLLQRRSHNTIDPSRQLPKYLQNGINAVASGSSSSSNASSSDMRLAAAARSYSGSLSQETRASLPPSSQQTPSPSRSSSSAVRAPPGRPLVRAATTNAAASISSSSASTLHRTASAPIPTHTRARLSHAVAPLPPVEHPSLYLPQTTFPEFTPRVFKAGQYTIQLLLDNRENSGGNREAIGRALRQNGLSVDDKRSLALGDVAWIAKSGAEECVLDVVLERKRLDDLVGSIKDGRFHEQKFRLHHTGISNVLYLVEEYDTRKQKEDWGVQISTALSSTQVVDGFMVKETKNINDTIAYLTGLTEELCRAHENKDLYVIPTHMIRRHSYLDLQRHLRRTRAGQCFVTSYADYQTLNSKSGFTTVRDTWTRMLLCVKGMSAEKVGAVVERWDTPRALWEAFRAAQFEEEHARAREEAGAKGKGKKKSIVPEASLMLQGVGGADGGVRAIGPALSAKVYQLLMADNYVD